MTVAQLATMEPGTPITWASGVGRRAATWVGLHDDVAVIRFDDCDHENIHVLPSEWHRIDRR